MDHSVETFSIKRALCWGWKTFKARPWFYIGVTALFVVINVVLQSLADKEFVGDVGIATLTGLLGTIVQWWLYIGFIGMVLSVYNGQIPSVGQLFEQRGKTLWHYVVGTVLYTLIVIGGLILLIVPGIIWSIKFQYYTYFVVERGMLPVEALKRSAAITRGHKWALCGFFLLLGLLNLLGVIAVFVGLFVTLPVSLLAMVYVYKWLETHKDSTPMGDN